MGCSMLNRGKKFLAGLAMLVCSSICFAGQISVQVVQHNQALDYVSEQSLIVEDELLNGFFDSGYIVTNSLAKTSYSAEEDSELLYEGFGEAFDGSSDFFVQVKLYFDATGNKGAGDVTPCRLDHIDWVVMKVSSGETLKSSSVKGSNKKPGTDENIRLVSNTLISDIQKAL